MGWVRDRRLSRRRQVQTLAVLRAVLLTCLACLGLVAATAAHAGTDASRELSNAERASLEAGGLVRRPMTQHRGSLQLMGGTSYQVIDAPLKVVWNALLDTDHYARMLPQVLQARVVRQTATQRTVFVRQGTGLIETQYYLTINLFEDRGDITFAMDSQRPHDLRAAWGFYTVRPYADGKKTLLAYGVMADIGAGIFGALVRDDVHDWMLKVPYTVKRFIEGSGRHLYRASWSAALATALTKRG